MISIQKSLKHALMLCQAGQFLEAKNIYLKLIKTIPNNFEVLTNLGTIELQLGNSEAGAKFLKKSISINPNQPNAISNLGNSLLESGLYMDAISCYDKAILINSDFVSAYYNKGKALTKLNDFENAIACYNKAIEINPNYLMAYINLGLVLNELARYDEAIRQYNFAIKLNPNFSEAYYSCGVSLDKQKCHVEALSKYDRAILLKPEYAEAYNNRAITLQELGRFEDALINYESAARLKPEINYLLGNIIHTKMHLCDWGKFDVSVNQLREKIIKREIVTTPFITLTLIDSLILQRQSAETYVKDKHPVNKMLPSISKYPKHEKIRIGYFSADFHNHATMHLMAELFRYHDKNKFELIAFSFGPDYQDEWRQKVISSFDQFFDVNSKSDTEVVSLSRKLTIDIAVDLKGFTQDARSGIFARRAAPIQVNYLGYPGTMGAKYIDYIIADPILIPEDYRQHYSEKIAYVPNSYQANLKERVISDKMLSRIDMGLPEDAFVFCSFNNNYKITPEIFDCWMRILRSVHNSVLWIFKSNDAAAANLKKEAEFRGVDSRRLIFASFLPVEEHLKRIQLADLFLDTYPYNAHTSASDALRVGLPVLTLIGESFAARVAASLLNAVGLSELITINRESYVSLAIRLGTNLQQLRKIKSKLLANLRTSSLYNIKLFTQHIEHAYEEMYQCYQNDLTIDHIYIEN